MFFAFCIMRKSILFITLAVIFVGILFGVISFILFEPTQVYETREGSITSAASKENVSSLASSPNSTNVPPLTVSNAASSVDSLNRISMTDLVQHNSQTDCWVGYNGKAYDITSFLPNHPGGTQAIARNCGTSTQFQDAFMKKHGTSKASIFMKVTVYKGELA